MGLVPHHALVNNTAPFVTAFQTIFTHGVWAGKLVAAVAVVSGIGALTAWTLVTTEVARAAASDGLFPKPFAWTDRKGNAWFGIVMAAAAALAAHAVGYTTKTGLTVFTELVDLTVVTVAIPYLFSACAQLAYLVSRRRRVQGWLLARDLSITGAACCSRMWVTLRGRLRGRLPGPGHRAGRRHPLRLPQGPPERAGQVATQPADDRRTAAGRRPRHELQRADQKSASFARPSCTGPGWSCPG